MRRIQGCNVGGLSPSLDIGDGAIKRLILSPLQLISGTIALQKFDIVTASDFKNTLVCEGVYIHKMVIESRRHGMRALVKLSAVSQMA